MTITPEIIAFVVAMAGIILPAMAIKIRKEKHRCTHHHFKKKIIINSTEVVNLQRFYSFTCSYILLESSIEIHVL